MPRTNNCEREYDFALVVLGVPDLTDKVENALFEAGCDDATLSIQFGVLYMEFSRTARSLEEAILSAIRDVESAGIGAKVSRVDQCNLVSASEIGRRIGRTRQTVHQYMTGARGPGGFPPPECYLADRAPLWPWCAVSHWLVQHGIIRPEEGWDAEVVYTINLVLERRQAPPHRELWQRVVQELDPVQGRGR